MTFTKQERHAQYATPMPLCKRHSHQLRPPLHHHHSKRSLLTTSTLRDITVFSLRTDRLSGWTEVYSTPKRSTAAGAQGLISCFRRLFATFGVPEEISSDGGPEFTAKDTKDSLNKWGVHHGISSSYFPQSNGRAEVAVKSTKRLLRSNIDASETLNSDKFLRTLLQLRNTPDPD